jgi:enamine deaminase RidA (YjgF/YER057c/UK114 family)
MRQYAAALLPLLLLAPALAAAGDVVRHKLGNGSFPIAASVEVPAGKTLVYLSGKVPSVSNAEAAKDSVAAYGDTRAQTVNVLTAIQAQLKELGLGMGDVVKMQVFLVGDPAQGGKMDFAGMMQGYTQFFGTAEQPQLPARSAMQVVALANPGFLVEIEVMAVRP